MADVTIFAGLAVLGLRRARSSKERGAGWFASTFLLLAATGTAFMLLPASGRSSLDDPVFRLAVAALLVFPYLLFRFAASFWTVGAAVRSLAFAATATVFLWTLVIGSLPGPDDPKPIGFLLFAFAVFLQWTTLTVVSVRILWGSGSRPLIRRRRRMMVAGALSLNAVMFLGATLQGESGSIEDVVVLVVGTVGALAFGLGVFVPRWLRHSWRAGGDFSMGREVESLLSAEGADDVYERMAASIGRCLDARMVVIRTPGGKEVVHESHPGTTGELTTQLDLKLTDASIQVESSAFTPWFSREELDLARTLWALGRVAADRAELLAAEREAHRLLDEAQEVAGMGSWNWDVVNDVVTWSDQLYRIYGLDRNEFESSYQSFLRWIHPDDVEMVRSHVEGAFVEGDGFGFEHRIVRPDGEVRHLRGEGKVVRDEQGKCTRMFGTAQDITQITRLERMKDEFIANAAHELRTPLTSMAGLAMTLQDPQRRSAISDGELADIFTSMARQGGRAKRLIDNLLDISRIDLGHMELTLVPTDVVHVVLSSLESAPAPSGKSVVVIHEGRAVAKADALRLEQVVTNLLANAYRYGGPHVQVEIRDIEGQVEIAVADDGPGVTEEFRPHLFEAFTRGSDVPRGEGSGLGLAICTRLVRAFGGQIRYESDTPSGARFVVTLLQAEGSPPVGDESLRSSA